MDNRVLLLQSGGRDSTAAAASLLDAGREVIGVTLSQNAEGNIDLPRQRAEEISEQYPAYIWMMGDFTDWDRSFKDNVSSQLSKPLPKSCLLCALSKITAVVPYCLNNGITRLAMGYTEYQSDWAEQTPLAIELQTKFLRELGIELILPARLFNSKEQVKDQLIARELSPSSLENPCCIAEWGTQDVEDELIAETIEKGFEYLRGKTPAFLVVGEINKGEMSKCQ